MLPIIRIFACVFENNEASARVLQKCGFSLEGTHRKVVVKADGIMDMYVYAILKPSPWKTPQMEATK